MPLYEYTCRDCDERFEVLQPLGGGARDVACPRCRGSEVEKVFSTFAAGGQGESFPAGGCGGGSGFT